MSISSVRIAGGTGTFGVANTTQRVRAFSMIQVNAPCVISQLAFDDGTNALTALNLGTVTWVAGILLAAPIGLNFASITLASGVITIS